MGLFEKIFPKKAEIVKVKSSFETLTAYNPAFTSWDGMIYETELVRTSIDAFARQVSKLRVEFVGPAQGKLKTKVQWRPNQFQTWSQFLYRLATIYMVQNNAFIVPITDNYGNTTGFYPVLPSRCGLVDVNGDLWLRYEFSNGKIGAVEFSRCGLLTRFQYKDDFFGANNTALTSTMQVVDLQNQGIQEAIKSSATFRFSARLNNFANDDDLAEEQKKFSEKNFKVDSGPVLLFPNVYEDIKQIDSKPWTVDSESMKLIQGNIERYFGANEDIIMNSADPEQLDAYYEGIIEPFAVQLAEVLNLMTYTDLELSNGNHVYVGANRLVYMKTTQKIQFVKDMGDRGFISINEGRELFNLPPIEGGDVRPIRGEYYFEDDEGNVSGKNEGGEE